MSLRFVRPRLWSGLWVAALAATVAVSLLPAPYLGEAPQGSDKLGHLLAYALLSAYAMALFASVRGRVLAAAGLVLLGAAIEVAQGTLVPETRSMDAADAVANAAGVLLGALVALTPARDALVRLDRALAAGLARR
ncbi:VanZ family protein [Coralloluteibacterium thermophilus]|uniref:VanZ family protein n=1 Tax=Coralloluteibacterium thermophilum TaxID=2707049 RepID=A0ABV9NJ65_9GAMM